MNTLNVVLYILCTRLFSDVHFTNIFSHSVYCLLVSLWYALKHKSLNFVEVIFFFWLFFYSVVCAFDVLYLRNECLFQGPEGLRLIFLLKVLLFSVQFSSVTQSCPTLCDPMNRSTPVGCPSPTPRVYPNSRPSSQ